MASKSKRKNRPQHWTRFARPSKVAPPRKIILKTKLSPGDMCTLTAAIESLHATYPGRFLTDVRTSCDPLFDNNPHITKLTDAEAETFEMHYTDLIQKSEHVLNPFLRGYCYDLGKQLGIPLELTTNRPHIYLSEQERRANPIRLPGSDEPARYWVLTAGVKNDFTLKQWPVEYYQQVIDHFRGRIQFVQIGSGEHNHPNLDGVINLVGQTDLRHLIQVIYHAQGGLGPITLLQHLCAAFEKPYVALLGGREAVTWVQYPFQTTLHTMGKLPCCRTHACWRSRVVKLDDEEIHNKNLCDSPVLGLLRPVGKCMAMIRAGEAIRAIEACFEGGVLTFKDGSTMPSELVSTTVLEKRQSEPTIEPKKLEMIAYSAWGFEVKIVPAWPTRDWMDATDRSFAYQCLPLTMANQSGWFVLAAHDAIAEWNGGNRPEDLRVETPESTGLPQAVSSTGQGILTWMIPYIFRTPTGWNLLCRGPANWIKDGIFPLEGLVETDWSVAPFAMNWKFTRPGRCEFRKGDPVAMLVPYRREDQEKFQPRFAPLQDNLRLQEDYSSWIKSREEFRKSQASGEPQSLRRGFQGHYRRGQTDQGVFAPEHNIDRKLPPFIPA